MSDCGELHHFLRIQVTCDQVNQRLSLDQSQLANQILIRFGISECKPVITLLESLIQLKSAETLQSPVNQTLFRQMIRSLMYLIIRMRPDIAATMSIISQFTSNLTTLHH